MTQREKVLSYAKRIYDTEPEYLWARYPGYAVLRHDDNNKWFGVIMDIPGEKLGLKAAGRVDILEVKLDPAIAGSFLSEAGVLPAYHMKKGSWLTALLNDTLPDEKVFSLLDLSFEITAARSRSGGSRITQWLVPANCQYFDVEEMIDKVRNGEFLWKQSSRVQPGDTVYIYVTAPFSAIRYKCTALETDIPYKYSDSMMSMKTAMRLKMIKKYDSEPIGLDMLRRHGVIAVRGPRSIPLSLIEEIGMIYDA